MAVVLVEDGKIQSTSASTQSLSSKKADGKSSLGKEDFLTLLVAQMKYQDPLQPASNTEYISQLATFSELEEMQNLNSTMNDSHASDLVGKTVFVKVTSDVTGETYYEDGKVDYIVRENGKVYLSIKDNLYSIDDLDTVVDDDYLDAVTLGDAFKALVASLPSEKNLSLSDKSKVDLAIKAYGEMTDYQKQFISKDVLDVFKKAEEKMKSLVAADEAKKFDKMVGELPDLDQLTADDEEKVKAVRKTYDEMSDFQKKYISKETLKTLEEAESKIKELSA